MKIKATAFGNQNEAFIENRIKDGLNVIFSNDNNKGKTLVMQSMLYAMGNKPIFPAGFNSRENYFYTRIAIDGKEYEFLRRNDSFVIKQGEGLISLDSVSELKYYISKKLFELPLIEKNGEKKIADLELFFQIFSVAQDKRNSSSIQNSGYYNKTDFMSMLKVMAGFSGAANEGENIDTLRNKIREKEAESRILTKKLTLIKNNPNIASQSLNASNRIDAKKHREHLNEINSKISAFRKKRSREENRKAKLQNVLSEIKSLNQTITVGEVICAECGSHSVIYKNGDLSFDLTNNLVRTEIISSLNEQISLKGDIIDEVSIQIAELQRELHDALDQTPVDIRNLLVFSDEIITETRYSDEQVQLLNEIRELKDSLKAIEEESLESKIGYQEMLATIRNDMNSLYRAIDRDGILSFEGPFSKNGENYSGSEEQEFYFSKLIALSNYFSHPFPIIMDSFRSGELSTDKERTMLDIYQKTGKQVIVTSTLKKEEYDRLKYENIPYINAIDYSAHKNSKILQEDQSEEFKTLLQTFGVNL